ncbi:MAG TPA: copper homeostasis membrane protein CopD [Devosiaceae bacterium]|nr:copper homeostasis membrane protein CopD [Devosiaceae bacterium]
MEEVLIACRFLHFSAAMLLFGASTFSGLLAPSGFGASLGKKMAPAGTGLVIILAITAVLWLCLESGLAGDGWSDTVNPAALGAVFQYTSFGQVWIVRLVLIALLLLAALLPKIPFRTPVVLVLSAAVLGSLGFVGHAAMQDGALGWAHELNHVVHLLSAAFWVGCLPPLLVTLNYLRQPENRRDAATALRRFSGFGHFAVALVIATGLVNTYLTLGRVPTDFSSPYQGLLATKIGLVALMMALALFNRYVTVPRLASGKPDALRLMALGTIAEIVVGAAAVALVSAFATFDPV